MTDSTVITLNEPTDQELPIIEGVQPDHLVKPDTVEWSVSDRGNRYFDAILNGIVKEEYREGVLVRVYESGTVRDLVNNRFVAGAISNRVRSDTARSLHQARKDKFVRGIEKALTEGDSLDWTVGVEKMYTALLDIAKSTTNKQAAVSAVREIRIGLGFNDQENNSQPAENGINSEVLSFLRQFMGVLDRAIELKEGKK